MKRISLLILLLTIALAAFAQQNLNWSLALVKNNQGVSFSRPVVMRDRESFNIVIKTQNDCYAYLIVLDSEKFIQILLNERIVAGEVWDTGYQIILPPGGSETFYVVISRTEQKELQNTLEALNRQSTTRTRRNVNSALMNIRRTASRFRENPEKPITLAGAFRGNDLTGTEYSGSDVYVKTIVINH